MKFDVAPLAGYQDSYGQLCAILQDGTREWRGEMDPDLSSDAVVWQPHENAHSIGTVILHIAGVEAYWFEQFALGEPMSPEEKKLTLFDETDVDKGLWPAPPRQPLAWYFDLHDRIRARTLESIKRWGPPETIEQRGDHSFSLGWVFGHVIQHESYHGGQAVLLQELWKRNG